MFNFTIIAAILTDLCPKYQSIHLYYNTDTGL